MWWQMKKLMVLSTVMMLIVGETQDAEHPRIAISSEAFRESLVSSADKLREFGFEVGLEMPTPETRGSSSDEPFQKLVHDIRTETPLPGVSAGTRGVKYDVILQPGHYGRIHGAIGTAGQFVSERALAAYVTNVIAQSLRSAGDSVLVVSADDYLRPTSRNVPFDGLRAKVFLAIHADGSDRPCTTGPSLGYDSDSSLLAMHAVGWGLAAALGYNYSDFNRDNFTANEARYYMFRQIQADRLAGLLEIGELTCPASEKQLINSSRLIGLNIARALDFIVQTPSE
jgi:N-acetylmuramoyl-L-alanine amidase